MFDCDFHWPISLMCSHANIKNIMRSFKYYDFIYDVIHYHYYSKYVNRIFGNESITIYYDEKVSSECIPLYYEYRKYICSNIKLHQYITPIYSLCANTLDDYNKIIINLPLNNEIIYVLVNYNIHMTSLFSKYMIICERTYKKFDSTYHKNIETINSYCYKIYIEICKYFNKNNLCKDNSIPEINKELCDKIINYVNEIDQSYTEYKNKVNEFNIEYEREIKIINEYRSILDNYIISTSHSNVETSNLASTS